MELKELQHEHPLDHKDLQVMYQDYEVYGDDYSDKDLIETQKFKCECDRCGLQIDWFHRYYYTCSNKSCNYSLHKFCKEIPTTLQSPASHPIHNLFLRKGTPNWRCYGCFTNHQDGLSYQCFTCNYEMDLRCATIKEQRTVHHPSHPHPLISVTVEPLICKCFACGENHEGFFYHCITCFNFSINSFCLSLPFKKSLKNHRSDHMLTLSYTSLGQQLYGSVCRICKREFYSQYWQYKCNDCMFYVHLSCATRDHGQISKLVADWIMERYLSSKTLQPRKNVNLMVELMNSEKGYNTFPEFPLSHESYEILREESLESVRTKVGNKKQHFSHKHPLVLIDTMSPLHNPMKRIELLCDGCVRPITQMPIYMCSVQENDVCSNFVLHERCAWLHTKCTGHPYHPQHKLSLQQEIFPQLFCCGICGLPCNGFAYKCGECGYLVDVHCAISIPRFCTHKAHPDHSFVLGMKTSQEEDENPMRSSISDACGACHNSLRSGDEIYYYECMSCKYHLDLLCALHLPEMVRHQYDKHPLKLSYSPIENYKGRQYFCEVCEEEFNPEKFWFYHCSKCAQSIHPTCALLILKSQQGVNSLHDSLVYKFMNIKFGGVYNIKDHKEHSVSFVVGIPSEGNCTICKHELTSKFIFKCLQCKFAIHTYCESSITTSAKEQLIQMFNHLERKREPMDNSPLLNVSSSYPKEITRPKIQLMSVQLDVDDA